MNYGNILRPILFIFLKNELKNMETQNKKRQSGIKTFFGVLLFIIICCGSYVIWYICFRTDEKREDKPEPIIEQNDMGMVSPNTPTVIELA